MISFQSGPPRHRFERRLKVMIQRRVIRDYLYIYHMLLLDLGPTILYLPAISVLKSKLIMEVRQPFLGYCDAAGMEED